MKIGSVSKDVHFKMLCLWLRYIQKGNILVTQACSKNSRGKKCPNFTTGSFSQANRTHTQHFFLWWFLYCVVFVFVFHQWFFPLDSTWRGMRSGGGASKCLNLSVIPLMLCLTIRQFVERTCLMYNAGLYDGDANVVYSGAVKSYRWVIIYCILHCIYYITTSFPALKKFMAILVHMVLEAKYITSEAMQYFNGSLCGI